MEAYIVKGYRSAVTKSKKGGFKNYRSDDLAVDVIKHLMESVNEITPKQVDDVIVGCANPEGEQGLQIGRLISARALGKEVAGITINRYCASGLEAIALAVGKIKAGFGEIFIAGGTESMSMIPMTGYKLAPSYKANIENINSGIVSSLSEWMEDKVAASDRPELTSAGAVVSGGRGVGSDTDFAMIENLLIHWELRLGLHGQLLTVDMLRTTGKSAKLVK